jgi:hypothetical protein
MTKSVDLKFCKIITLPEVTVYQLVSLSLHILFDMGAEFKVRNQPNLGSCLKNKAKQKTVTTLNLRLILQEVLFNSGGMGSG